jgi:hypothetical protein
MACFAVPRYSRDLVDLGSEIGRAAVLLGLLPHSRVSHLGDLSLLSFHRARFVNQKE